MLTFIILLLGIPCALGKAQVVVYGADTVARNDEILSAGDVHASRLARAACTKDPSCQTAGTGPCMGKFLPCKSCAVGKAVSSSNKATCVACTKDSSCDVADFTKACIGSVAVCKSCPAGKTVDTKTPSKCTACLKHSTCLKAHPSNTCIKGVLACAECGPGLRLDTLTATMCVACQANSTCALADTKNYCRAGVYFCNVCANGKTLDTTRTGCVDCQKDPTCTVANTTAPCESGLYQCSQCAPGKIFYPQLSRAKCNDCRKNPTCSVGDPSVPCTGEQELQCKTCRSGLQRHSANAPNCIGYHLVSLYGAKLANGYNLRYCGGACLTSRQNWIMIANSDYQVATIAIANDYLYAANLDGLIYYCDLPDGCITGLGFWANMTSLGNTTRLAASHTYIYGLRKSDSAIWQCAAPCVGSATIGVLLPNSQSSAEIAATDYYIFRSTATGDTYSCLAPCESGAWVKVKGTYTKLAATLNYVFGLDSSGNVYYSTIDKAATANWSKVTSTQPEGFRSITASPDYAYGVGVSSDVLYRCSLPVCTSWADATRGQLSLAVDVAAGG